MYDERIHFFLLPAAVIFIVILVAGVVVGKRLGRPAVCYQAPLAAGLTAAVVYLRLTMPQMMLVEQAKKMVYIHVAILLVSCVLCIACARTVRRYRLPATLGVVAVYALFSVLPFIFVLEQISTTFITYLYPVAIFVLKYLFWVFPLAVILLPFHEQKHTVTR